MGVGRGLWSLYLLRDTPSTFPIAWLAPFEFFNLPNSPNRLHVSRLSNFSA